MNAQDTGSGRFIRNAGQVREDPNHRLWGPVKWVAQLIQYMVALILITVGEGLKAIFRGDAGRKNRRDKQS